MKKRQNLECLTKSELHQGSSLKTEWIDSCEAAKFLRLSVAALRNLTSMGQIPYYKLGRRNRYRKDELETCLLQNKRGKLWE